MSLSGLILLLWGASFAGGDLAFITNFIITPMSAGLAGIAFVVSMVLYIVSRGKEGFAYASGFISYILMCVAASSIIVTTGHTKSPFIVIWLLIGIFAGLFGLMGFWFICVVEAAYVTYLLTQQPVGETSIATILFVFVLPLIFSLIIWRKNIQPAGSPDKAYSELAKELSQVSSKSDIVINAIADGVIAVDGSSTIRLINPAAQSIIGWGKQDAIGLDYRSVLKMMDSKDHVVTDSNDPVQEVLKNNQPISRNDLSVVTNGGKKMIVSLVVSPVGQAGSGCIIVFRDITDQVAENRQKAEFVSTASHEMRTPVAAIEGYIGLALNPQTATIDDKARAYLLKAHESAAHLGQLFQDLLDISKAEDGRLSNNPSQFDVGAFIRDVMNSLRPSAEAKQIALTYAPDNGGAVQKIQPVYFVTVDPNHLREVLSNLITNAIKYTKEQGMVTLDISGDTDHVTVSVVDNGIGIPAEDIPHLFQKFYRVDNTDTREIGGTGLGLYLCRKLVETMNGRIWVESIYGKGSMFFIELPRTATIDQVPPSEGTTQQDKEA